MAGEICHHSFYTFIHALMNLFWKGWRASGPNPELTVYNYVRGRDPCRMWWQLGNCPEKHLVFHNLMFNSTKTLSRISKRRWWLSVLHKGLLVLLNIIMSVSLTFWNSIFFISVTHWHGAPASVLEIVLCVTSARQGSTDCSSAGKLVKTAALTKWTVSVRQ